MKIDFTKGDGLVPVIIQDDSTLQVLMLGYMNQEAFMKTKEEGRVTFYSRSRQRLWTKGETSGNYLEVKDIHIDCDRDSLLIRAIPSGPVCHTGDTSCFKDDSVSFLHKLEQIITQRIADDDQDSYTNRLYRQGINKVAQKVGEEVIELLIEAKDDNTKLFREETADLLYHLLVLLRTKNVSLKEIEKVLATRQK